MLICISDYADRVEFCLNMVLQIYKCTAQTWSRLISNRMRPLSLCSRILQTPFPRSFHSPSTNRYSLARFSSSTFSSSSPVFTSIFSGSGTTGSKKIWESSPSWGQNKTNVTYILEWESSPFLGQNKSKILISWNGSEEKMKMKKS